MGRFLFSLTGGYGHFHPVVPPARALQQKGHDVAFAVGARLRPQVEAAGFDVFEVGGNIATDPEYQRFQAERSTIRLGLENELFAYPRLFCGMASRLRTPELVEICRSWHPDMLIREGAEYGAILAAEHLGLPHATVAFAAALKSMPIFEREAAAYIDPVRQQWGLAPDPHLESLYRYLYIAYSPPGFSLQEVSDTGIASFVPATTHFIRPNFFDQADDEGLPDWVAGLAQQPTIYVTLGTEVNKEPELYPNVLQTMIEGLRDAPANLIVTLGRDKDPADFGPQPANVHIERYIPQSLLLPHCDIMVMHGGSNSVLAALDNGLPLVVVPLIADQFFNAHVTQTIQLGKVVQLEQLSPGTIRAAAEEVLRNPAYRRTAKRLQAEMQSLPDQKYAVELIERVAAECEPVTTAAAGRR